MQLFREALYILARGEVWLALTNIIITLSGIVAHFAG